MEFLVALIVALCLTSTAFLSGGWILLQYSKARRTDERGKLDQLHQHRLELIQLDQQHEASTALAEIEKKAREQAIVSAARREETELKLLTAQAQAVIRQGQSRPRFVLDTIRERVQQSLEG